VCVISGFDGVFIVKNADVSQNLTMLINDWCFFLWWYW